MSLLISVVCFLRHHRTSKGGVSYILFRGIGGQETLYLWIEREGETVQPKIRSDKAIPHCQPRICGPSHWGVVMCFFKCPISTDTHSNWLHSIKLNTRIETMQVEDNIRDMREAIPQCQSRISQRYLRVISLYLSLSYLSKCAAPYLPTILLCSASSLSRVGSFSWSVCFSFVRLFKGL